MKIYLKRLSILLISIAFCSCSGQETKINGISFVGSPQEIDVTHIDPVVKVNANWAAVMPFGFVKNLEAPNVVFNIKRQWWGERREGVKKTIELLNQRGIKIMLKPQIWVWKGEFTGNISMSSEENWKTFEDTYEDFILLYAQLAEEMDVPLLCIGTELHTFVQKRPEFWRQLIKNVRSVYKGKLTYAENWDQFGNAFFWDQLDYIGIDAYFPVSDSKTPTVEEVRKGWKQHKNNIAALQSKIEKPVLFTEYGYRSIHYTGKEPWDSNRVSGNIDLEAQNNALQALYNEFWKEPWFAGGFLWKWYHNHQESGGKENNRFTIQNKPAEELIRSLYRDD
ncbi:glycoside hydrolase TIM-barrel-like domain-containing protein [Aquimarina sp. RZ0]|uniref:glycoside hydrolase family 113 n=1 Tax=Aquimarina sp. RZ0 TaxID=2607730 RepID=UPI0011F31C1A|nr:glycoside hydrolase TIM-barrel-like domain-containing protein [Aquimarina sp. RZ0]KAA1243861.1 glycoside hydrolase [Aquimarina sp. RZ0]